jgi:hypothetical protein
MNHLSNEELLLKHLTQTFLYEGYVLYPSRHTVAKGEDPAPLGILYPESYCDVNVFVYNRIHAACLLKGDASARLSVRVRFLQIEKAGEAIEREICPRETTIDKLVQSRAVCYFVSTPATPVGLRGRVVTQAFPVDGCKDAYRMELSIENCTTIDNPRSLTPETALRLAFASTHAVLALEEGEFISAQNPPVEWVDAVRTCRNERTHPVLVGDSNRMMLCSPVMFYDHPLIRTGFKGDIFDNAEADQRRPG